LFGSAAKMEDGKQAGGQGVFLLTVNSDPLTSTSKSTVHEDFKDNTAARYLGYGIMEAFKSRPRNVEAGELIRACINENQIFIVTLISRGSLEPSILNALKVLGLLGGLGSRSRHGMGSIALEKIVQGGIEIWTAPTTQKQYQTKVKELVKNIGLVPEPEYSAFSKESRVDHLLTENSPYKVLNAFGTAMLMYRSWGKYGKVLGKSHEKGFEKDHSWYKNEEVSETGKRWRESNPDFHPERVVFGLPHNYGKYDNQKVNGERHERRASPLFFHVHYLSNKEYLGISVFLKSRFLPPGEKIMAGRTPVNLKIDWTVITNFIEGKVGNPPTTEDRFPNKKPVLP